jgi:Bacterial Ig-like domain/Carboxypeptidase regulatory-like domain
MKKVILMLSCILLFLSCEEKVFNTYETDPRLFNDAFHGNIIGKVLQKNSQAKVTVSQVTNIANTTISSADGSFSIVDLEIGNYDLTIQADNFRTYLLKNVNVQGAGNTYLGDIDLSTVPDLVASHYPEDMDEIVYDNRSSRLSISMTFTQPMDRESVEEAFSTNPPTDGIFYWGTYSEAPSYIYYLDAYSNSVFETGATITTYSKISSFTYRVAQKDSYVDTTYNVTLSTSAKDTAGNSLRFPLNFSFSTIQSSTTQNSILTDPYHGDVDVNLLYLNGINITFPRNMDFESTEVAITMVPDIDRIFIWPAYNKLTIYTGGPFLADTDYKISINESAKDRDGTELGEPFSFEFNTASVAVSSTFPRNGQLFVDYSDAPVTIWFNTYMLRSTVESSFSISPPVSGTFQYGSRYSTSDKTAITFFPSGNYQKNTKYTIILNSNAKDLYQTALAEPYEFSFITMPE